MYNQSIGSTRLSYEQYQEKPIKILKSKASTDSLPIAHTWYFILNLSNLFSFNELELPNYESKEILKQKLIFAVNEGKEGFHIE